MAAQFWKSGLIFENRDERSKIGIVITSCVHFLIEFDFFLKMTPHFSKSIWILKTEISFFKIENTSVGTQAYKPSFRFWKQRSKLEKRITILTIYIDFWKSKIVMNFWKSRWSIENRHSPNTPICVGLESI